MKILGVSKMELQGKTVIITGAGAGIGEGISLCLADAGADIAIIDINKVRAEGLADKIQKLVVGHKSIGLVADATNSKQIK